MKTTHQFLCATLSAAIFGLGSLTSAASRDAGPTRFDNPGSSLAPSKAPSWNATPRGFIPNVGQVPDPSVKFTLRDGGVSAFFTERGFILWTGRTTTRARDGLEIMTPIAPRWSLTGARPVAPIGGDLFPHTVSFFLGNDPARWHPNTPSHRVLRYPEILEGVEMRVECRQQGFEYEFLVKPHSKPELRFRYDGVLGLGLSETGDLVVRTGTGQFTESRPISFQTIQGMRRDVASRFELVSTNEYRIVLGSYDPQYELTVDPVLDWSTSVGGSYGDQLNVLKIDPSGDVVVAGISYSVNLPITAGLAPFGTDAGEIFGGDPQTPEHSDVYIAKFSADGTQLRWAGYLGGEGASAESIGRNRTLAVDAAGDVYITTHTRSTDFPVWPAGSSVHRGAADASITKIKSDGSEILWSKLMGDTGEDYGYAVDVHGADVYLAGVTSSPGFPANLRTFGGMQDAFVAKLDAADGQLAWVTFLGGSREERVSAVAADATGVTILGDTDSADFHSSGFPPPTTHDRILGGNNDAFLTRFNGAGSIEWSTYLGGSGAETSALAPINQFPLTWGLSDMTRDSGGNIIAVGHTYSADFPGTSGSLQPALTGTMDGYVTKLTPDGSQVLWSTYLGGSGTLDRIGAVAVNPWDEVFVGGATSSIDFPTIGDPLKPVLPSDGTQDGFLAKLDRDGRQLVYSTYVGNNGWNDAVLALDYGFGRVAIGGWHFDTFIPITAGAFQQNCDNCGSEMFVMQFLDAFLAQDGFESGGYTGGSGWTENWVVAGDASVLTSAGPHSGTRHVRLRRGTGLLRRNVNVPPGTTTLALGFWSKVHSFEGTEHGNIVVNGVTVRSLGPAQSDNIYHYYEVDLTPFLPAVQVQIAFDANMGDQSDNWYLDDIRLVGTSEPLPPMAAAGPDQAVTDTDNNGSEPVTLDGSASVDPDGGTLVSYVWTEGATVLGVGNTIHPSLSVGAHTITLTVTDDEGVTASDTVQVTVNAAAPPPSNPMHSGDLDAVSALAGKRNWKATVTVTIHDGSHNPVSNATVTVVWSGTSGTTTMTTDAAGQCTFISNNVSNSTSMVSLNISHVSHDSALVYSPAANHDPDGDSNGTLIDVLRP